MPKKVIGGGAIDPPLFALGAGLQVLAVLPQGERPG
jgi:hypothetical protein